MGALVYQVDDSSVALKMLGNTLKSIRPDVELKQFTSAKKMFTELEVEANPLLFIFSDYNMPEVSGIDVLSWVKRNPKLHFTPVVMVTAELEQEKKELADQFGAHAYVTKPYNPPHIAQLFEKRGNEDGQAMKFIEMDCSFADEVTELVEQMHKVTGELDENVINALFRMFHTIKGGARALQFPIFSGFMHIAENFLTAVKGGNLYPLPKIRELLLSTYAFIEAQADQIRTSNLMEVPPLELVDGLKLVKANVDAGWKITYEIAAKIVGVSTQSPGVSKTTEKDGSSGSGVLSRTATSCRIANEKLDHLQTQFKRILQLRVRMSSWINQIAQEFPDEDFPRQLAGMTDDIHRVGSEILEFFIALRVVPVSRLKAFSTRVINESCEQLGKTAHFVFDADPTLELDQVVVEALEGALIHLLRNSIDHGLESFEERKIAGKDDVGQIHLELHRLSKDTICAILQDDGRGINVEKLKESVLSKGLVSKESLDRIAAERLVDLVFVDGVSTRDNVTETSGRGVGLSAVREKLREIGGSVEVGSTIGKGTQFKIMVPRFFQL